VWLRRYSALKVDGSTDITNFARHLLFVQYELMGKSMFVLPASKEATLEITVD
jgi:hypothetical protein